MQPPIILRAGKGCTFYALGKIENESLQSIVDFVSLFSGESVSFDVLDNNLKQSFERGNVLYFEKQNERYTLVDRQTESTNSFAVYTGFCNADGDPLYAQYYLRKTGWTGVRILTKQQILDHQDSYQIGSLLFDSFDKANRFIVDLHAMLMPGEIWSYENVVDSDSYQKTDFSILQSYLMIITSILTNEWNNSSTLNYRKIVFSVPLNGTPLYVLLNTGLLSNKALDIYIYGMVDSKRIPHNGRFWIKNPVVLTNGETELLKLGFQPQAQQRANMVEFFRDIHDVLFDTNKHINYNSEERLSHCIDDGLKRNRFPAEFTTAYNNGNKQFVITAFRSAIENSIRIAKRNYKFVVPHYRRPDNKKGLKGEIQFLMPIYMKSDYSQLPDFALVLSKRYYEDGQDFYYHLETVLELPWAYNNARAICKPDNTWLDPEKFKFY